MGLIFRRSIKIGKNTRLNISKSGIGISTGVKGARIGIGPRGIRETVGIPGTGMYYSKQIGKNKMRKNYQINTKHSPEWIIFGIIAAVMVGASIFMPVLTILFFSIIGISFIGYLVIHAVRKFKKA